ncbi:DNA-binding protein [Massilia putida]|uniref:DNA-binding protein n=1 Tax=Massilia putida TaxID=1141883 RepID=UPI0012EB72CA|nr:DNA-binding protein [Massilia putida]
MGLQQDGDDMARSGLTKSQVREARDRLLAEGRHPSVDAVRHALGDSGSKSTIHKHLKELRGEDGDGDGASGIRREDTGRALHALVDALADRLHADFDERVRLLRAAHDEALRARDRELAALQSTVATLTARVKQLETEAQFGADDAPLRHWQDSPGGPRGFGHFDNSLLNSRSFVADSSPFDLIRAAARS